MNNMPDSVDTVQCGDSAFLLKQLPDACIDLVVTSPPYFRQRNYNGNGVGVGHEKTVDSYVESLLDVFHEVVRIVKPTGNIVYNIGDKYLNGSLQLVPYQFAILATKQNSIRLVNDITWVKKNPTPRQFDRRLVSSTEPFFHFSKGQNYYYDPDNYFDECEQNVAYTPSNRLGHKYRKLIKESDLTEEMKESANKSLDQVIEEVIKGEIQGFRMKIRGIHAEAFGGQEGGRKAQLEKQGFTIIRLHGKKMKKDVINSAVESIPGIKHTAIFPVSIIKELIKLLCPMNGIVLDPYFGSGTTGVAAIEEHRHFLGIDIDPLYCDLAKSRIGKHHA